MKEYMFRMQSRSICFLLCVVAIALLISSCGGGGGRKFTAGERHAADSIVRSAKGLEGLDSLIKAMDKRGDKLGQMVALREKGKLLRNESQFAAALTAHSDGLRLAEQTGDTLEQVQALNNIGTDYRRMGILDMAQRYHYGAWMMAKECSDTSRVAKKNRVVSLNGLANVYLTTNNLSRADSALRLALAGETELGSLTGQAINYANLGSIFEQRNQNDSAWAYYRKSMELNQKDGNTLGIALCHTYFGDMHKKAHDYDAALKEYQQSYAIMADSKDNWHALNSLFALATVYELKGDNGEARKYLDRAKRVAQDIKSNEHLAEIYRLYYKMYKRQGDYRSALSYHEMASAMEDSLVDVDKMNRMQNTSLDMERGRQDRLMAEANDRLSQEQTVRHVGYIVFVIVVVLMGAFIATLIHARRVRAKSHRALRKLNDMRETFFRNITHEFRTPLTVILGLSHDLQQPGVDADEAQDMGKTIERQGQRMLRLINQLLDISKIRSEIGTPDWRNGNIVAYITMIVEAYTSYANRLGIKLEIVAKEKEIDTDFVPDYVSKVVGNLLSNALKFTETGGTVSVRLWQADWQLHIDVADTGRGIPKKSLPHIFEEFYQSDNVEDGVGTGVGLALVHQIVLTLSGTITVDSAEGRGTTFHIALPIRRSSATPAIGKEMESQKPTMADESSPTGDKPEAKTAAGEAPRVLVVEDNADIAAFIGKRLDDKYQVEYAQDGKQGLEKAHEWMPDVIVTDLMMPQMDGLELCRRIRADELTSHIPIIVVTARVSDAERVEGLKAGADAYLTKPFNSEELQTRVEMLLEQRRQLREKFAKALENEMKQPNLNSQSSILNPQSSTLNPQITEADRRFLNKVTDSIYLMLNSRKSVDVGAVASQLCMSYGQFNRKLSALTGYTPAQYIQRMKIKRAQRMLVAHPELGFNDVAERCGFSDYSNFVRAFKNVCGMTPTQYVRQE